MSYKIAITGGLGFIGLNCLRHWIDHSFADRFAVIDDFSVGNLDDLSDMLAELGTFDIRSNGSLTSYLLHSHDVPPETMQDKPALPDEVRIDVFNHDITQLEGLETTVAGAEAVVHLAAQTGVVPCHGRPGQGHGNKRPWIA